MVEKEKSKLSNETEEVTERGAKSETFICKVKCTWKGDYYKEGQKVTSTEKPPKEYFTKVE